MKTKSLTYTAVLIAIALLFARIPIIVMPFGGSLSFFSMFPIVLIGYFYGARQGVLAGLVFGIFDFILAQNHIVLHPVQFALDYIIANMALGLSGLFYQSKIKIAFELSYVTAVLSRYVCVVISGIVFFSSYAPENTGAIWHSLTYNATYILPEAILTIGLLQFIKPQILKYKLKVD